jgi:IclR family mhp operon transcriptional activator
VTAIGFPIRVGEHAIGAINLIMQSNAVSERDIAKRYAPLLRTLADQISEGVARQPRQ